ncbi:MAG: hypothetical protein AAF585_09310 [Verrucomicrobiota bacterium]
MESGYQNPKLAEIDIALSQLESCIADDAAEAGFEIIRSFDGAFDIPHRRLWRFTMTQDFEILHSADIRIAVPIDVRLERGFYPEIPIEISAGAILKKFNPVHEQFCERVLIEAVPYSEVGKRLSTLFSEITSLHQLWDYGYILKHGQSIKLS